MFKLPRLYLTFHGNWPKVTCWLVICKVLVTYLLILRSIVWTKIDSELAIWVCMEYFYSSNLINAMSSVNNSTWLTLKASLSWIITSNYSRKLKFPRIKNSLFQRFVNFAEFLTSWSTSSFWISVCRTRNSSVTNAAPSVWLQ